MNDFTQEQKESFYGKDAAEWLRRWDNGEIVWSIEMGGLGPGYEQCIQIAAAEVLRYYLKTKPDVNVFADQEKYTKFREKRDVEMPNSVVDMLGLSGAQHGAACNLAGFLYRFGPVAFTDKDKKLEDRIIQVSKTFPGIGATNAKTN